MQHGTACQCEQCRRYTMPERGPRIRDHAESARRGPRRESERSEMVEQFADTQNAWDVQKRFTDPKACQQWGGHCWLWEMVGEYLTVLPPKLGPTFRTCKHCGLKQRGVYQEPVRWEEVPA